MKWAAYYDAAHNILRVVLATKLSLELLIYFNHLDCSHKQISRLID
jgi:hypothetical protein